MTVTSHKNTKHSQETSNEAITNIQRALDFFPENGRNKLGYGINDCLALIFAVGKLDRPTRRCSQEIGTQQSWSWLGQMSGIPERTLRRILKDYLYLGGDLGSSLLNQAAEHTRVRIRTEARSQILTVSPTDSNCRFTPHKVDSAAEEELGELLGEKSARTYYGEGYDLSFPETAEIEV